MHRVESALVRPRHRKRRLSILLVAVLLVPVLLAVGGTLIAGARAGYVRAIVQTGKEPAFLLTLAFLVTFGVVRLITYGIRDHALPLLHNLTTKRGLHIHHMVACCSCCRAAT
jgi:hypothetical protein